MTRFLTELASSVKTDSFTTNLSGISVTGFSIGSSKIVASSEAVSGLTPTSSGFSNSSRSSSSESTLMTTSSLSSGWSTWTSTSSSTEPK